MEKTPLKVLYLEDSPQDVEIIRELIIEAGFDLSLDCTEKKKEFTSLLKKNSYDVVLSDFRLAGFDAFGALEIKKKICPDVPFICVSGSIGEEIAIELIRKGAVDYVLKDRMVRLPSAIKRVLNEIKEKEARRKAEETLHENQARFRATFENANVGICIVSLDGSLLKVNKEMSKIFGYSCKELERMTVNSIAYQDDIDISPAFIQKAISDKIKKGSFDKRYVHKDGHIVWGNVSSVLVRDSSGKPQYFISHIQDITRRKRAEEALRESEEKFRTFAEQSPNMIFINKMGKIVYANAKCEEIMGYTKEEFYSPDFNFLNITAPEHVEILKEFYKRHLKGEEVPPYEYAVLTKQGKRIDVIITSKLIPYENEKAILGIITDITERKQAENLLYENQEAINAIVETSQDWIWSLDSNGIHTYSNPAVEKILGYKPEEIVGKDSFGLIHEEDKKIVESVLRRSIREKSGWSNVLLRWRNKNGAYRYLESNAVPILDGKGEIIGFRGVDRDITERKQIEKYVERISDLKHQLLSKLSIDEKLKLITNCMAELFDADIARIWIIKEADLCEEGCRYAAVNEGPDACRDRTRCLHLIASSGRYTGIYGGHRRIPLGWRKIGCIASGEEEKFLTNDIISDSNVQDKEWIKSIGLVSFAGYKIISADHSTIGVMALFKNRKIEKFEEKYLEDIANTTSQVIIAGMAEEALRENEMRYKALVESQTDLISRYRPDTTLTFVNDAYCKFYGKTREEFIGHSFLDWVAPEFHELVIKETEDMVKNPGLKKGEYLNYNYKSKECWIQWIIQGITDENGKVVEIQGVGRDVTDRRQAEEALRESEEKFRSVVETALEGVWFLDSELKTTEINDAIVKMLGYTREEIIGRPFIDFVVEEDRTAQKQEFERRKRGISGRYERRVRCKDGSIKWLFLSAKAKYDSERKLISAFAMITDITERKQMEYALLESEKNYRELIDGMNETIWIIDFDGNIIDVNRTAHEVLGYSKEELLNIGLYGIDSSLKREDIQALAKAMPADKLQIFETTHRAKDGNAFPVEVYSSLVTYQGKKAILSIARDITERKHAEEALRQIQKLEGLGTLAGGIAHDFNNILGIILAYNTGIRRFKDDEKKLDQATETITKAVERGKTIVQQILTFARKTETTFGAVNINEVVTEVMTMIFETFPKTLTYAQNYEKGMPFINADRSQLYQALLNLCVNARDAMPNGGLLTINTRVVPGANLRTKRPDITDNNYVCIEISDTGEGMTEDIRKRIFEPFFTTKGIGKGTGLGLAVVFGVVQTHKGFVDVESEFGKGTTFRLYIPAVQVAGQEAEKEEEKLEEIPGGTETLLVVEDEEMLMMSLQMVLLEKGYNVLTAMDGMEALKVYQENKDGIALVLTDLGLPTITGLEVCQRIKDIKSNERMILATGYLDPEMKSEFLKAGIRHFLFKPYDLKKVLKTVREALD